MKKTGEIFKMTVQAFRRYHLLLAVAGILIISVVFYGLHDRGMIIAYCATAIIMFEITYRWRQLKYFLWLALGAFFSSIFLSFLHEVVVIPLVRMFLGSRALNGLGFRIFHDAVSLWILFPGIMGLLTGIFGMIALGISLGVKFLTGQSARKT